MSSGAAQDIAVLGLGLDARDFKAEGAAASRTLQDIKEKAGDAVGSTNALADAFKLLGSAAGAMAAVLGSMQVFSWVKGAVELAARYETLGIVLTTVGHAAGYTSGFLNNLTGALEKTGISMKESRQVVISMIQAHLDLSQATKLARVAQDAAVTANLNSSETLQRMVFGIQSSHAIILRSIGLNVSWEDSYKKLAVELHKMPDQLTENEKAQGRVNAVLEAGKTISGAYVSAMETAGKQMKSLERYTEDLKVKVGTLFLPAYTIGVFAMADAIKFLAQHTEGLLVVSAALVARGMVPLLNVARESVASFSAYAVAQFGAADANAIAAAAAYEATAAEQLKTEIDLVAANAAAINALATEGEAVAWEALTVAQVANTAATEAHTASLFALTDAEVAATSGAMALAVAGGIASKAMAMLGGPAGIILMILAGALIKVATETSIASEVSEKYADELDKVQASATGLRSEFEKLAAAQKKVVDHSQGKALQEAVGAQKEAMNMVASTASDPQNFGFQVGQIGALKDALQALSAEYERGSINIDTARSRLVSLAKQYPEQVDWLNRMWNAMEIEAAAHMKVSELQKGSVTQREALTAAIMGQTTALDKYLEKLDMEARHAQANLTAFQLGGPLALKKSESSSSIETKSTSEFASYAKAQGDAVVQAMKFNVAIGLTDGKIQELAKSEAKGRIGTVEYATSMIASVDALKAARQEAANILGLVTAAQNSNDVRQLAEEAHQRELNVKNIRAETTEIGMQIGALRQGVQASADMEITTAGLNAARALGEKASLAEKNAIEQATEAKVRASQKEQQLATLIDTKHTLATQLTDTQRLSAAELVGASAVKETANALAVEDFLLKNLLDRGNEKAKQDVVHLMHLNAVATAQREANKAVHESQVGIADTYALIEATKQGELAIKRITAAQAERRQFENLGPYITLEQRLALMLNNVVKAMLDAKLASQQRIASLQIENDTMTRQIDAVQKGAAAQRELNVQLALEAEIRKNPGISSEDKDKLELMLRQNAALKQQLGIIEQVASRQAEVFKNLIKSMQDSMATFFEGLITQGISSFEALASQVKSIILRMLAEIVVAGIMRKFMSILPESLGGASKTTSAVPDSALPPIAGSAKSTGLSGLGVGLGAFTLGYGLSSASHGKESALGGAAAGAAMGAAIGSVVPVLGTAVGAVVGAVGGLVGGLLGHAQKAKEGAQAMADAQQQYTLSIDSIKASLSHNTLAQALAKSKLDFDTLRKQAEDAYQGGGAGSAQVAKRMEVLAQLNVLEIERNTQLLKEYVQQQAASEMDSKIRILRAQGFDAEADALAFAAQQQKEYMDAAKNGLGEAALAALALAQAAESARHEAELAKTAQRASEDLAVRAMRATGNTVGADNRVFALSQQREMQDATDPAYKLQLAAVQASEALRRTFEQKINAQIQAVQDANAATQDILNAQLTAQQDALNINSEQLQFATQTVSTLQQVVANLGTFRNSLELSSLSPLSPVERYANSKQQLDAVYAQAKAGDTAAAASFETLAKQFLTESQSYNASTPEYGKDYSAVIQMTDSLTAQFGAQLTDAQKTVNELTGINDKLTANLVILQAAAKAADDKAAAAVKALQATLTATQGTTDAVNAENDAIAKALDVQNIAAAVANVNIITNLARQSGLTQQQIEEAAAASGLVITNLALQGTLSQSQLMAIKASGGYSEDTAMNVADTTKAVEQAARDAVAKANDQTAATLSVANIAGQTASDAVATAAAQIKALQATTEATSAGSSLQLAGLKTINDQLRLLGIGLTNETSRIIDDLGSKLDIGNSLLQQLAKSDSSLSGTGTTKTYPRSVLFDVSSNSGSETDAIALLTETVAELKATNAALVAANDQADQNVAVLRAGFVELRDQLAAVKQSVDAGAGSSTRALEGLAL